MVGARCGSDTRAREKALCLYVAVCNYDVRSGSSERRSPRPRGEAARAPSRVHACTGTGVGRHGDYYLYLYRVKRRISNMLMQIRDSRYGCKRLRRAFRIRFSHFGTSDIGVRKARTAYRTVGRRTAVYVNLQACFRFRSISSQTNLRPCAVLYALWVTVSILAIVAAVQCGAERGQCAAVR